VRPCLAAAEWHIDRKAARMRAHLQLPARLACETHDHVVRSILPGCHTRICMQDADDLESQISDTRLSPGGSNIIARNLPTHDAKAPLQDPTPVFSRHVPHRWWVSSERTRQLWLCCYLFHRSLMGSQSSCLGLGKHPSDKRTNWYMLYRLT
jgi:hypothetical protein